MATLTASEITFIRAMTGDTCGPDYDVSDEFMQYIHDNAATTVPLCLSSVPLGGTIVWVLEARVVKAAVLTDESGDGTSVSYSQKYTQLSDRLEAWKAKCGMSGGVITMSTLDLGLDRDDPVTEYAALANYPYWFASYFG
jgi:hypothetical protein